MTDVWITSGKRNDLYLISIRNAGTKMLDVSRDGVVIFRVPSGTMLWIGVDENSQIVCFGKQGES